MKVFVTHALVLCWIASCVVSAVSLRNDDRELQRSLTDDGSWDVILEEGLGDDWGIFIRTNHRDVALDNRTHSGNNHSLRIQNDRAGSHIKTHWVVVQDYRDDNSKVRVSFWFYAIGNNETFNFEYKTPGTKWTNLSNFTAVIDKRKWTKHTSDIDGNSIPNNRIRFRINNTGRGGNNKVCIDNLTVSGQNTAESFSGATTPDSEFVDLPDLGLGLKPEPSGETGKQPESDVKDVTPAAEDITIIMDGVAVAIPFDSQDSYNDGQDERMKRPLIVSADGRNITLEGNIHRAIPLPSGLSIGASTTLDVDFTLTDIEEVQAICIDENLGHSGSRCFVFAGTQTLSSSWTLLEPQATVGETRHYQIPLGGIWGESKNWLIFMQDNDSRNRDTGSCSFANIDINHGTEFFIEKDGTPIPVMSTQQKSFGRRQDSSSHFLRVSSDGASVRLVGNMHRSVPLETPVTIDANTNIDFDFTLVDERDVHALCFTVGGESGETCLVTAGTQVWGDYNLYPKTEVGETRHYSVPVGLFFDGTFDYVSFMQDNDTRCRSCGDATWANVKLSQVTRPQLMITAYGDFQEIDSATEASADTRQDTRANFLEFPDSVSVTLKGNTHRALSFSEPIMIDHATDLDFDFTLEKLEELHSICIVTNTDPGEYLDKNGYCFTAAGTQNWNRDERLEPQTVEGGTTHYHYPIGMYVPSGLAYYLVFMQDNDTGDKSTGECTFSNIEFSQRPSLNVKMMGVNTPLTNQQISFDRRQDTSSNLLDVSQSGDKISMYGNLWKAFAFPTPITLTDDAVLSFTLDVEEATEITAICLEEDLSLEGSFRCFKLSGTQTRGLGYVMYQGIKQTSEGEVNSYHIKLSEYFTGVKNYLVFIHDNDSSDRTTGISHISDLQIYNLKPSCLSSSSFNFAFAECTFDNFVANVGNAMSQVSGCAGVDPWGELLSLFDLSSDSEVRNRIKGICDSAYVSRLIPFNQLMAQEKQFVDEFFDGGNSWNYEIDEANGPNLAKDAAMVKVASEKFDGRVGIDFPDVHNFENCELRAAMCCYVATRDGGQKTEPDDNSDACYMEFSKARQSSHVRDGYSIYSGTGDEGPLNCHGFAWGNDSGYSDAAFKGNTLFQVAMKHGLYEEGNVEELPGAPMCGCVEHMPVVTRAACTKTVATQTVSIKYNPVDQFVAEANVGNINHSNCGDLSNHYASLVAQGKASAREKALLDKHLVGENQCGAALTGFLKTKGFAFA